MDHQPPHLSASAAAASLIPSTPLHAQEPAPTTPDEALKMLMDGNKRFDANNLTSIAHDLKLLREHNVDKQQPFAAVLSCADSRVPVELVFDQTIGHIFVCRVAGNIINAEIIGSLEYGAASPGVKVLSSWAALKKPSSKAAKVGEEISAVTERPRHLRNHRTTRRLADSSATYVKPHTAHPRTRLTPASSPPSSIKEAPN